MEMDIMLGVAVVVGALGFIIYLALWSRRRIDRIADQPRSARTTLKDLQDK